MKKTKRDKEVMFQWVEIENAGHNILRVFADPGYGADLVKIEGVVEEDFNFEFWGYYRLPIDPRYNKKSIEKAILEATLSQRPAKKKYPGRQTIHESGVERSRSWKLGDFFLGTYYVVPWALSVDEDGYMWLDNIVPSKRRGGTTQLKVTIRFGKYYCTLRRGSEVDVIREVKDTKGLIPVHKLEYEW
jgi:hypothetical protein